MASICMEQIVQGCLFPLIATTMYIAITLSA